MAEQKPRNRYEQIKAALKDVDLNPFDEFGSPQERAFKKMMKRDPERAAKVFPDLFREYAQKKADGGTVMKETGGLYDEGGTVDEESGNDVPVGSTKKEVRDDIPAMLSEGEFVLPADVVRYHGLEKIMQLRDEAKFGLQKMEAMGQMGNADEATLPDDVPFGMDDLLIVVGPEAEEDKPEKMMVLLKLTWVHSFNLL